MRKLFKSISALTLAAAMVMGMGISAVADDPASGYNTNDDSTTATDTSSVNLIKKYVMGAEVSENASSPAEDFNFTIKPYGVWNAGSSTGNANGAAYSTTNMPALAQAKTDGNYSVTVENTNENKVVIKNSAAGSDGVAAAIDLNDYNSVGDFWYEVEETIATTTGVIYGTNSDVKNGTTANTEYDNANYLGKYYIHVQVINNPSTAEGASKYVRLVTCHTVAPGAGTALSTNAAYNEWVEDDNRNYYTTDTTVGAKVQNVENTYYAGDLVIKKTVTGNAGDKDKYFAVTVTFTKPAGTVVNSDIAITGAVLKNNDNTYSSATNYVIKGQYYSETDDATTLKWNVGNGSTSEATATAVFYVKDGSEVTFMNIPYGINYTVTEALPADDTYKNEIKFTDSVETTAPKFDNVTLSADTDSAALSNDDTKSASGSISDKLDVITIENNKQSVIDIGVILSNAPFIAMLIVAAIAVVIFARRKKNIEE